MVVVLGERGGHPAEAGDLLLVLGVALCRVLSGVCLWGRVQCPPRPLCGTSRILWWWAPCLPMCYLHVSLGIRFLCCVLQLYVRVVGVRAWSGLRHLSRVVCECSFLRGMHAGRRGAPWQTLASSCRRWRAAAVGRVPRCSPPLSPLSQ